MAPPQVLKCSARIGGWRARALRMQDVRGLNVSVGSCELPATDKNKARECCRDCGDGEPQNTQAARTLGKKVGANSLLWKLLVFS